MVSVSAVVIDLSTTERAVLTARARAVGRGHRDVLRARIGRSSRGVHRAAGRRGHGVGVRSAGRASGAVGAVVGGGVGPAISARTVQRWPTADAIKPWQHRSWIFPRDPAFAVEAGRVLDLYDRWWEGIALGGDEYVICADEKSRLQVLQRRYPGLAAGLGRQRH